MTARDSVTSTSGANDSVSETVIRAIAIAKDVEPTTLTPLYNVLDPDALDDLFPNSGATRGQVKFIYEDYAVTVKFNGDISVHPKEESQLAADD